MIKYITTSILISTLALQGGNPIVQALPHLNRPFSASYFSLGSTMIKESFQIGNILLSPISKSESPWFSMSTSPRVVNSAKGSFAGSLIGSMPAGSGTLGLSLRYFQSGEIIYRDSDGNDLGLIRPYATDRTPVFRRNPSHQMKL